MRQERKYNVIRLSNTNHDAVRQDVEQIVPDWNGGRDTRRLLPDMTLVEQVKGEEGELIPAEHERISGNRLDVVPLPDRVLQEAELDEEGNLIQEQKLAGELRFDIPVPDEFPVPELQTRVYPQKADHVIL